MLGGVNDHTWLELMQGINEYANWVSLAWDDDAWVARSADVFANETVIDSKRFLIIVARISAALRSHSEVAQKVEEQARMVDGDKGSGCERGGGGWVMMKRFFASESEKSRELELAAKVS